MSHFLKPGDAVKQVGTIFATPLLVRGTSWLPLVPTVALCLLTWGAGRRHPQPSWRRRLALGAASMPVVIGSEWGHNLAHAAAAQAAGRPADGLLIFWGLPLLVYHQPHDPRVSPRQHILRSLAGPLFNLLLLPLTLLVYRRAPPGTLTRELSGAAAAANAFIGVGGLAPLPFLDGGPILRWSLVSNGYTQVAASRTLRRANWFSGIGFALVSILLFLKRRWLIGALLAAIAAQSFGFASGRMKVE